MTDADGRPAGIITQGDLVRRAEMPLRLGLLTEADSGVVAEFYDRASAIDAEDVMTAPVRTVRVDQPVSEAIGLMRKHTLKRLPVVDEDGILAGVITRLDVFRAAVAGTREPDAEPEACYVEWQGVPRVGDCMTRETGTVTPEATIDDVLRRLDEQSVQRVAVVDEDNRLLGLLTDRDILAAVAHRPDGFVRSIINRLPLPGRRGRADSEVTLDTTAGEIMKTGLITVTEDATLEDALRLMIDHALKRLPVVDADGHYLGMISRNALLRLSIPD